MLPRVRPLTLALAFLISLLCLPTTTRAQDRSKPVCEPKAEKETPDETCVDPNEDPADALRRQILKERMEAEKGKSKSKFFEKVHVDGLWMPGQSDSNFFGVVGTHITVIEMGRVHLFGPPGVMVLRTEGKIRTALTWGFSLYLTEFRMPGSTQRLALFGDFARAWTFGDYRTGMDMAGLSVAWRR